MRFCLCQGRLKLELCALRMGRDLQVILNGGAAHLGAVALAAPGGAADDALSCTVCVSAGIHYENISKEEIAAVERLAETLTERCLAALATQHKDEAC